MKRLITLLTVVGSFLTVGCTQYVVLFKPPANLDPIPLRVSESKSLDEEAEGQEKVPWNIKQVGLGDEKSASDPALKGNLNVKVAILSTGIDYNHEDLIGQVGVNWDEVHESVSEKPSLNFKDDDQDGLIDNIVGQDVVDGDGLAYDRHGAGTAVAGIIAAKANNKVGVRGVVDKVNLFPVRFINDNGQTDAPKLAEALSVAVKAVPDVIFLQTADIPLGGSNRDPAVMGVEKKLISVQLEKLKELKIPVVVGAGESMQEFELTSLGQILIGYQNVIVVTSVNEAGNLSLLANRGRKSVTLAAPGDKVYTTLPKNQYGTVRGTAFAAAHVVGALAIAKAQYGEKMDLVDHVLPAIADPKSLKPNPAIEFIVRSGSVLDVPRLVQAIGERL